MKKVMLFVVSMLFAVSVNAASLNLTTDGAVNASQIASTVLNNGPIAIGSGETAGGDWHSFFNVTTDQDTWVDVEWSFNPEQSVIDAVLQVWHVGSGLLGSAVVAGNALGQFYFLAGEVYNVDFLSVTSGALSYIVSVSAVSAVPVPAALLLFAPALLGFLGLRRKAVSTSVVAV